MNGVAIIFILQLDNQIFGQGLAIHVKAQYAEKHRVDLVTNKDRDDHALLLRTKVYHIAMTPCLVIACVLITRSRELVPFGLGEGSADFIGNVRAWFTFLLPPIGVFLPATAFCDSYLDRRYQGKSLARVCIAFVLKVIFGLCTFIFALLAIILSRPRYSGER